MDLNPRRVALLVAANTALAPFAIDAYLPAMGQSNLNLTLEECTKLKHQFSDLERMV